jgi:lipopolysaccharide transport system ATP-binding protein
MESTSAPTIYNITHIKSGSQWVRAILTECAPQRIVTPRVGIAQFYDDPLIAGAIYPALYIPYDDYCKVLEKNNAANSPRVTFVVIRDLRDTMVSLYYSLKVSHPLIAEQLVQERRELTEKTLEDGLLMLIEARMGDVAEIQRSWIPACDRGEGLLLRYEDLIANEQEQFARIVNYCQLETSPEVLREIVTRNSFEKQTGRHKGEEDTASHFRKGIVGDWRNAFSDKVKQEFKRRYGDVLIQTGYESGLDW